MHTPWSSRLRFPLLAASWHSLHCRSSGVIISTTSARSPSESSWSRARSSSRSSPCDCSTSSTQARLHSYRSPAAESSNNMAYNNGVDTNKFHSVKTPRKFSCMLSRKDKVVLICAHIGQSHSTHSYILKKDPLTLEYNHWYVLPIYSFLVK